MCIVARLCLSCLSRAHAGYPVFWHSGRKSACRDGVDLVSRWVLRARERGVSNTLLVDQRVCGRRDRIGLDSAVVTAAFCRRGSVSRGLGECMRFGYRSRAAATGRHLGSPRLSRPDTATRAEAWASACGLALGAVPLRPAVTSALAAAVSSFLLHRLLVPGLLAVGILS